MPGCGRPSAGWPITTWRHSARRSNGLAGRARSDHGVAIVPATRIALPPPFDRTLLEAITSEREAAVNALRRRFGPRTAAALQRLARRGRVRIEERLRREHAPTRRLRSYEVALRVDDDDERLARRPALRALYAYLRDHPLRRAPAHELRHSFANATAKSCASWSGPFARCEEESHRPLPPTAGAIAAHLTTAQRASVDA